MKEVLLSILEKYKGDAVFGGVVQKALCLVEDASSVVRHSSTGGLASLGIARMYRVRMSLDKFKADCFFGLEQSIQSLEASDIDLNLWVIEAEEALASVWLSSSEGHLVGIVIAKLSSPDRDSFGMPEES